MGSIWRLHRWLEIAMIGKRHSQAGALEEKRGKRYSVHPRVVCRENRDRSESNRGVWCAGKPLASWLVEQFEIEREIGDTTKSTGLVNS